MKHRHSLRRQIGRARSLPRVGGEHSAASRRLPLRAHPRRRVQGRRVVPQDKTLGVAGAQPRMAPVPSIARAAACFAAPGPQDLVRRRHRVGKRCALRSEKLSELPCDLVFPVLHGSFGEDGRSRASSRSPVFPTWAPRPRLGSRHGQGKGQGALEGPACPSCLFSPSGRARSAIWRLLAPQGRRSLRLALLRKALLRGAPRSAPPRSTRPKPSRPRSARPSSGTRRPSSSPSSSAREIECAVLGNDDPIAFGPGEVAPTHEFYDYEAKYLDPDGARLEVPPRHQPEQAERVQQCRDRRLQGLRARGHGARGFLHRQEDGRGAPQRGEHDSRLHANIDVPAHVRGGRPLLFGLITRLAELALERHAARVGLRFSR